LKVLPKEGQEFPQEGFELLLGNAKNSLRRRLLTVLGEGQEFLEVLRIQAQLVRFH
jgi:hypothetical protein